MISVLFCIFQCFDRLRYEKPRLFESKVQIIAGDIEEPLLGENSHKIVLF